MAYLTRHEVTIVTDASGDGTGYTPVVNGFVHQIRYVKTDYADGVDFTVTADESGVAVWTGTDVNASVSVATRQATVATDGSASLYAATGEPVETLIAVADERVKLVVASGGDTKTGTFHVYVGG